jgi:hypothetical protein
MINLFFIKVILTRLTIGEILTIFRACHIVRHICTFEITQAKISLFLSFGNVLAIFHSWP